MLTVNGRLTVNDALTGKRNFTLIKIQRALSRGQVPSRQLAAGTGGKIMARILTAKQHGVLLFAADGELIEAPTVRFPVELRTLSYEGELPVLLELTAHSSFGEIRLRQGFKKGVVELKICGRQFRARLVGRPKNSPLLRVHASDVFAALFPPVTFRKGDR